MRNSRRKRKSAGQTLVEFALVLPIFLLVMFSIIEMARVMNAWVTLRDITLDAAAWSSRPDPLRNRGPGLVFDRIRGQLRSVPWVVYARDPGADGTDFITVDVNDQDANGIYYTRIDMKMTLQPLALPNPEPFGMPIFVINTTSRVENYTTDLQGDPAPKVGFVGGVPVAFTPITTSFSQVLN